MPAAISSKKALAEREPYCLSSSIDGSGKRVHSRPSASQKSTYVALVSLWRRLSSSETNDCDQTKESFASVGER